MCEWSKSIGQELGLDFVSVGDGYPESNTTVLVLCQGLPFPYVATFGHKNRKPHFVVYGKLRRTPLVTHWAYMEPTAPTEAPTETKITVPGTLKEIVRQLIAAKEPFVVVSPREPDNSSSGTISQNW